MPLLSFPHLNVPPPPLPPPPPPPAVKRSISAPAAVEDARFEGGVEKFNESFKARYTRARLPTIEVYIIMQKCLSISQDLRSIWGEAGGDHREGPSPPETPRTPLEALSGGETAAAFPFNTPMENSLPPSEENLESSRYRWRNSHIFAKQMYTFFYFSPVCSGKTATLPSWPPPSGAPPTGASRISTTASSTPRPFCTSWVWQRWGRNGGLYVPEL